MLRRLIRWRPSSLLNGLSRPKGKRRLTQSADRVPGRASNPRPQWKMVGGLTSNRSWFRTRPTSRTRANGSTQPSNRCGKTSSIKLPQSSDSGKTNQERMEGSMNREKSALSRRNFLKQGAAVGLGLLAGSHVKGSAWAASKERITILSSSVTDTLNPYNHSGSLIYGMWQHIYEPLVEVSYNPVRYTGALAESWEFRSEEHTSE